RHRPGKEPSILSVAPPQRERIFPWFPGVPGVLNPCDDAIHMIRMMNGFPPPTLHLLQRRARIIEPALVVPEDPTFGIGHPCELRNIVRHVAEPDFAFLQRPFVLLTFGEIVKMAYHAPPSVRQHETF